MLAIEAEMTVIRGKEKLDEILKERELKYISRWVQTTKTKQKEKDI